MKFIKMAVILLFLALSVFSDIRHREVEMRLFIITAAAGLTFSLLEKREAVNIVMAMIPGIIFFAFSFLSKGALGAGDGIFLMVMALFYTAAEIIILLLSAIFLSGIVSGILLLIYKIRRKNAAKASLPFLCFYAPYILFLEIGKLPA